LPSTSFRDRLRDEPEPDQDTMYVPSARAMPFTCAFLTPLITVVSPTISTIGRDTLGVGEGAGVGVPVGAPTVGGIVDVILWSGPKQPLNAAAMIMIKRIEMIP